MDKNNSQTQPILYSFRRCPYAIRARFTLCLLNTSVLLREICLKKKPQSMLKLSPKGTVPVLWLPKEEQVIDESWKIMLWACQMNRLQTLWPSDATLQTEICYWVTQNDTIFKPHLDQFKYPERFKNLQPYDAKSHCEAFFQKINTALQEHPFLCGDFPTLADIALFPFIRQASKVDEHWFKNLPMSKVHVWLNGWLNHPAFLRAMQKVNHWDEQAPIDVFL